MSRLSRQEGAFGISEKFKSFSSVVPTNCYRAHLHGCAQALVFPGDEDSIFLFFLSPNFMEIWDVLMNVKLGF